MNTINQQKSYYPPSFQAYYKSSFGKQLEQTLTTGKGQAELVEKLNKILKNKTKDKHRIGKGAYGTVYRIDDYFVMKLDNQAGAKTGVFKQTENSKFEVLKTYFGKVLAKIGNISILCNVTKDRKNFIQMVNPAFAETESYNKSLKEFASLPQRAFDKLAQDFKLLNEIHKPNLFYKFDTINPNNFIKVGKSIKIVDEIDWVPYKEPNDIYSLMRIFIKECGNTDLKKELFKKCALACEKHKLPMDAVYDYQTKFMDDIIEYSGIKMPFEVYYDTMQTLRQNPNDKQRLNLVKEFLNSL